MSNLRTAVTTELNWLTVERPAPITKPIEEVLASLTGNPLDSRSCHPPGGRTPARAQPPAIPQRCTHLSGRFRRLAGQGKARFTTGV